MNDESILNIVLKNTPEPRVLKELQTIIFDN